MRIIVGTGKGGVGKSLTTHAIAVYLASLGQRTVIVDCDKRKNATGRILYPDGDYGF